MHIISNLLQGGTNGCIFNFVSGTSQKDVKRGFPPPLVCIPALPIASAGDKGLFKE